MYRIVIADDEQVIRNGLRSLKWKEHNMDIVGVAKNGIEAQEFIDGCEFDILLTDIKMPGISGLELAKSLNSTNPKAKTILLSGYGEFEYAKKAITLGVFDYILKPSTPDSIIECVTRACEALEKENQQEQLIENLQLKVSDFEEIAGVREAANGEEETDIRQILKYIYSNYDKPLTLSALASDFHFSTVYLSCYIKKYTGHTFLEILTSVRMYHAARLLAETRYRNAEIGERIGIPDERYFGQVFKKKFGKTPYEYRKLQNFETISLDDFISVDRQAENK